MVRVSPAQYSVASGELSELMHGRRDFVRFQNGARALRGFIALPEGPVTRLPGTRFMGFTRDDLPARLMAFSFRDEDAVLLEWTEALLRFWRLGVPVLSGPSPYQIATPYLAASLPRLKSLVSADRVYLVDGTRAPHRLSRFALTNWSIEQTPFTGGPFAPRNSDATKEIRATAVEGATNLIASVPIFSVEHEGTLMQLREIDTSDTPYWDADSPAKIGDKVYYNTRVYQIVAFDGQNGITGTTEPTVTVGPPAAIADDNQVSWAHIGTGNIGGVPDWTAGELVKLGDRRYFPTGNATGEVSTFTSTTSGTFSGSSRTTGVNPPVHTEGLWLSGPTGPVWKLLHDGAGIVRITSVSSPTLAVGVVEKRLPDGLLTRPTYRWAEQAWSDTRGWPAAIGSFEQRHLYGGTFSEPRTLWTSVIGGTTDMTTGILADDGFSYILNSLPKKLGAIHTIQNTGDVVYIGTTDDELTGRAPELDSGFTRDNCRFGTDSTEGSRPADPVVVENSPLFLSKDGLRLLSMVIDPNTGRFRPENLTKLARHILAPGATKLVYQSAPVPVVWAIIGDGQLAGVTFVPSEQVIGFHRHDLGGVVEDIEVMPSDDGSSQDLWLVVRRVLNGITRRCIERMEKPFIDLDGQPPVLADAWHQMCAFRWQGAATATIPCPPHLEGMVVTAWTDMGGFAGLTVTGAQVILPRAVTSAIIGLDVTDTQRFDTLDIVTGQPDGGDDGRLRTHRVGALRLHRSAGGTVSVVGTTDATEVVETDAEPFFNLNAFQTPTLHDGVIEPAGLKGWDHQIFYRIRPEPGAPLTITARTPTIMITDD
jgi:hypothetical protein